MDDMKSFTDQLDQDLVNHVYGDDTFGFVVHHPLIVSFGIVPVEQINLAYRHKANAVQRALEDRDLALYVFLHERPYRLDALLEIDKYAGEEAYWTLVGDVWTDSENTWQNLDVWEEIFSNPNARMMMNAEERERFEALPEMITIYRGCWRGVNESGLSWSLSRERAEWFSKRMAGEDEQPIVLEKTICKNDVIALIDRRGEEEILVLSE